MEGTYDRERYLINWYNDKAYTTLFIDGNHDNQRALNSYPVTEWNGGKVHKIADSVYHLMRGQVFTIDGLTFFTMGGADSVDKFRRVEGKSWWPEEMPSKEEYKEAIANLKAHNNNVDYIITHCCGTSLIPLLGSIHYEKDDLTVFLDSLEFDMNVQFKHWYFGHHHRDRQIDDKYTCVYNLILEVK